MESERDSLSYYLDLWEYYFDSSYTSISYERDIDSNSSGT